MLSLLLCIVLCLKIYINLDDKYKEIVDYIIIGVCTTIVSIVSYYLFRIVISNYLVCTILSWIVSVTFAYITNRSIVFHSKEKNIIKEFIVFVGSRILSLLLEMLFMFILVDLVNVGDRLSKILVQFIIIVLNYIFSKIFVFKRKD